MSARVTVLRTQGEAFLFGLRRWPAFLRFAWLPALIAAALSLAYWGYVLNIEAALDAHTYRAMEEALKGQYRPEFVCHYYTADPLGICYRTPPLTAAVLAVILDAVLLLLLAGVLASMFRLSALGEERRGVFHLRLDAAAWRVFSALLVLLLISAFFITGGLMTQAVFTGQNALSVLEPLRELIEPKQQEGTPGFSGFTIETAEEQTSVPRTGQLHIGAHLALIPLFYVLVRLAPLLPAAAAGKGEPLRSLAMTARSFWPLAALSTLNILVLAGFPLIWLTATSWLFRAQIDLIHRLDGEVLQASVYWDIGAMLVCVAVFLIGLCAAFAMQCGVYGAIYRRLSVELGR